MKNFIHTLIQARWILVQPPQDLVFITNNLRFNRSSGYLIGLFLSFLTLIPLTSVAQVRTITTAGDWDNPAIWMGSAIGDDLNETVTFTQNIGTITIPDGVTITVGSINMSNGNTLAINGTLHVGDASNLDDLVTNNSTSIIVNSATGAITIWGNLIANNNLTLVLGTLTIKGNLDMNNSASMDITGDVQIDGDFIAGTNADVNINAGSNLNVDGSYNVGNGSVMTGEGSATGNPCTGPVDFCINSPLPVELTSFEITKSVNGLKLDWQTATELNNDYFDVERSEDGMNFYAIARMGGHGTTTNAQQYRYTDKAPLAKIEYYRLKQVDFDGAFEYSKTIVGYADQLANELHVTTYPNPAAERLSFRSALPIQFTKLSLVNIAGQEVVDLLPLLSGFGLEKEVKLPNLERGFYFIAFQTADGQKGSTKVAIR